MLTLPRDLLDRMIAHCLAGYPDEACGLLGGDPATGEATSLHPTRNVEGSAKLYAVDPLDHLRADRAVEASGYSIIGVFHSHTHTDPYPSPTDVNQAPDPEWHYVIVSLRDTMPMTRSYRIRGERIDEEPIAVTDR